MKDLVKEIKEHFNHYLILAVILNIGVGAFWYFRYLRIVQLWIVGLTGLSYVIWGAIHHYLEGDFHTRVILEYFSTALLGLLVVVSLLLRT